MGATSSSPTICTSPSPSPSPSSPTLTVPTASPKFSSCTTPSRTRSSSISPTLTSHTSRTPSMEIPQHIKGKTSSPLSYRMKRFLIRDSSAWDECEKTETITNQEYHHHHQSQYRQYQSTSTSTPRFEISSPRLHGMEGTDDLPLQLTLPQPVITVPVISRTIHIQPNPRLNAYFSRYANDQCAWLSLEWILATRSATHGLFDAYPYHVFDAFLLRTHPTARPCLDFLHAEQSFRDKWSGWSPCAGDHEHAWKISIMIAEAKTLYQNYLIPIISFLSSQVISRLEDKGLNSSTSIDPTQDTQDGDVTLFIHGDMFLPAVHEVMHSLRTGPFQSFIRTRQYQELGEPTHSHL